MFEAASQYYDEDATQAEIAERLGVSRPTVSRLLAEARRVGIVEITVRLPEGRGDDTLAAQVANALRLQQVYLVPTVSGTATGRWLAPGVARALQDASLAAGDVVLVSSGLTVYGCVQQELPLMPGVIVAPAVGGQEEPEPWYQTNLIVSLLADRIGGRPIYLYAPALPSAALLRPLMKEPSFLRVQQLWARARCALIGVGGAPGARTVIPSFVPTGSVGLRDAVGDVCSRFYSAAGDPVKYPGSERLVAISFDLLHRIPSSIAVAAGQDKAASILAAARAGYFSRLVTDVATASGLLAVARSPR
ncbi:MAG TPA: sugar-binding domain-containing protein [Dermatophilaceae bacterium]|nr:sugar-binding domain-containing protein [Dermatophilaceae bacterium]